MKAFLTALILSFLALPALAAPEFPPLTGRVVDDANILSPETERALTQKLAALEAKNSRQLVVVTVPSLGGYEISDYGYQLGRNWGIGQGKLNNGALLIVAPKERRVRIEVGYGLEPIITDAFASVVINSQIRPRFRQNDYDGGVTAGVDALIEQLSLEPSVAEQRAAAASQQVARGNSREDSPGGFFAVLLVLFVIFFIFRRHTGGLWPLLFLLNSGGRGGGGWGGGSGGGWGGGGFSGGGGSFGGGGASGSW